MSTIQQYSYPKSLSSHTQQGAVLIVVLLFLVLIIFAGVIAVKQSTTDLRLATSDQINTLLLQSADNANQNIEQSLNGDTNNDIYKAMMSKTGPFGYFVLDNNNSRTEDEYVFCFRPRDRFFDINKTSVMTLDGSTVADFSNKGYCNPAMSDDYISARNASMTQLNVSLTPRSPNNEVFISYTIGQDSSEISSQAFLFDIDSTAILPAYSGAANKAKECFEKTSRLNYEKTNKDNTIAGCMAKEGVPSIALYEIAAVENKSASTKCSDLGKGSGKFLCTLPSS